MKDAKYPNFSILIVDDEMYALQSLEISLRTQGIDNVLTCEDSRNVLSILEQNNVGIVLLDLTMPNISGEELICMIREKYPDLLIIVTTAINEAETAVQCMHLGAYDYLVKPIEKGVLIAVLKRVINMYELKNENKNLKNSVLTNEISNPDAFSEIITVNKAMLSIFQYIESVATTSQPVLITGETGVGKELIARSVHKLSKCKGPFVAINAGGLDDNVFSDTLFGHVKGSFTGAQNNRKGLIETAFGGTLFLDEIGDLNNASQVKLLRLLQEQEYFPLGADVVKKARARIVVATNKNFESLHESGEFRKDLYYRLRAHHLCIPPLRDRMDDLPILLDYFLQISSSKLGKKKPTAPDELLTMLSTYNFPGNIRELEAMVFDAVSNHKSKKLSMDVFKSWIFKGKLEKDNKNHAIDDEKGVEEANDNVLITFPSKLPTLKEAVQLLIKEAMERSNNNQNIAAIQLGITRQALNKRLQTAKNL